MIEWSTWGFYVQASGYQKHSLELEKRGDAAVAILMNMLASFPGMSLTMRRELFVSKVRSVTGLGAEIWGWTRAYALEKADARVLRILMRVRRRPKNEALWWVFGILPPWVATRKRAFDCLCGVIETGASLERAALEQWWCLYESRGADGVLDA